MIAIHDAALLGGGGVGVDDHRRPGDRLARARCWLVGFVLVLVLIVLVPICQISLPVCVLPHLHHHHRASVLEPVRHRATLQRLPLQWPTLDDDDARWCAIVAARLHATT